MNLELTEISLCHPQLPPALDGLRLLQIADLHTRDYGPRERLVKQIIGQDADLLLATGDSCFQLRLGNPMADKYAENECTGYGLTRRGLVFRPRVEAALAVWRNLLADANFPLGIYAIQGNHDPDEFIKPFTQMGINLLVNDAQVVSSRGGEFNLAGLRGFGRVSSDIPRLLANTQPGRFTICLSHYPELVECLAAAGFHLVLSGHTHGGQVCLPGGRPISTHCWTSREYVRGLNWLGQTCLYTSRGLGYSMLPLRIYSNPEIVRLTLHPGPTADTRIETTVFS